MKIKQLKALRAFIGSLTINSCLIASQTPYDSKIEAEKRTCFEKYLPTFFYTIQHAEQAMANETTRKAYTACLKKACKPRDLGNGMVDRYPYACSKEPNIGKRAAKDSIEYIAVDPSFDPYRNFRYFFPVDRAFTIIHKFDNPLDKPTRGNEILSCIKNNHSKEVSCTVHHEVDICEGGRLPGDYVYDSDIVRTPLRSVGAQDSARLFSMLKALQKIQFSIKFKKNENNK